MVRFVFGVEDLADTRFAIWPLADTVRSLWALADPDRCPQHGPWLREARAALEPGDRRLLLALVGPSFALPDFLTPRPSRFAPSPASELARVLHAAGLVARARAGRRVLSRRTSLADDLLTAGREPAAP